MLTPTEKKNLIRSAHALKPTILIGKSGLTEAVLAEAEHTIAKHELVKIKIAADKKSDLQSLTETLCARLNCYHLRTIGKTVIVYRQKSED